MIPECLRKFGVREISEEEYREMSKPDPEFSYKDELESESESENN